MVQLSIKGHTTRGEEVIEILKMLGGRNDRNYIGDMSNYVYTINEHGIIDWHIQHDYFQYNTFTLEEFLKKFPYKIWDKVQHKGATSCGTVYVIERMEWVNNHTQYEIRPLYDYNHTGLVTVTAEDLQPYTEETIEGKITMNEDKGTLVAIDLTREFKKADEIEVILGDYEFVLKNGKTYFVKRYKYPKTYEECCKVLMGKTNFQDFDLVLAKLTINKNEDNTISPEPPYITSINSFYKLLICRDAYWKIAGEQMGLGKSWKPDWNDLSATFHEFIKINNGRFTYSSRVLAFPTEEMYDAFYENFKDLIEQCKELL